jgi:hypothetical protein
VTSTSDTYQSSDTEWVIWSSILSSISTDPSDQYIRYLPYHLTQNELFDPVYCPVYQQTPVTSTSDTYHIIWHRMSYLIQYIVQYINRLQWRVHQILTISSDTEWVIWSSILSSISTDPVNLSILFSIILFCLKHLNA